MNESSQLNKWSRFEVFHPWLWLRSFAATLRGERSTWRENGCFKNGTGFPLNELRWESVCVWVREREDMGVPQLDETKLDRFGSGEII